ncbi:hypothetical protein LCGC14_2159500, partial [marine sediment metagenome]
MRFCMLRLTEYPLEIRRDIHYNKTMRKKKRRNPTDLVGKRFGRLVVLSFSGRGNGGHLMWNCQCDCGVTKPIAGGHLRHKTKSCGCLRRQNTRERGLRNLKDLTGKTFSNLTVIHRDTFVPTGRPRWVCRCSCGTEKTIAGSNLVNGTIRSCGCLIRRKGADSPAWRGGRWLKSDGYVERTVYDENGIRGRAAEHRLVMEEQLGRKLKANENVHH